ncbi:fasciclin domain-containing protein [Brevundimonas sp. AJA228-03]|uniref:fasciclin domain-containing protein n=1 Tax=Brevundimonas sp. AJA228-03 TaxID=2752515 RepID=UPI001AE0D9D8|nr:fasciclin domain-containing protein [Brevundimonas sp. AJA228-03]QTN19117.1 fasciclin domain-containing protein [Brevundimonas sp. AJA228-03]
MNPRILTLTVASAALLAVAACNKPTETAPAADATATDTAAMAPATTDPVVGGASMSPTDTIVTNAAKASNLTTLVSAVQAAGLAETLSGPGPFTVFAPDNAAFEKIPAATRESLMAPAGKADLTGILTYHVVPGRLTAADLAAQATAGGGTAELTTVQGGTLKVTVNADGSVTLTDAAGGTSKVTQADVLQSNGVVHVIDTVVMPG